MSEHNEPYSTPGQPPYSGEPWNQTYAQGPGGVPPFPPPYRKKSKWAAGLLAFFIPGTGHFYLGMMQKGLLIMALMIMDIVAIAYFSESQRVPLIILCSLLMPVVYFYNIFDSLQNTDIINDYRFSQAMGGAMHAHGVPERLLTGGNAIGWLFVILGGFFFFTGSKPAWMGSVFHYAGSYAGAVILIAIGAFIFLRDKRTR